MREPSTAELLEAWERGLDLPAPERALALLAAADPESSPQQAAGLPVGERDARLLALREWAFGSRMAGAARCPSCGIELEIALDGAELRAPSRAPEQELSLRVAEYEVRYRLPDSVDMREAARAGTVAGARRALLRRCVVGSTWNGAPVEPAALPEEVVDGVEDAMAEHDPQADVRLALSCAGCGHEWEALFDAGLYLWAELDRWARRTLVDVATLASAFGWTEPEVLRLSPLRREAYLELAGR